MNNEWRDMPTMADVSAAVVGHINEDGECYPVITVDCDQYYSGDSLNLAKFYAAANPSAISELISAYREAVAALKHYAQEDIRNARHYPPEFAKDVLATAKRLGAIP